MKQTLTAVVALAAIALFTGASAARAAEAGHGSGHGSEAKTTVSITSLSDAVNATAYFHREVESHIQSNKLGRVHASAFAASDAAARIPEFATSLTADQRKQLDGHLNRIKSIAKQLDKYGDAGKGTETKQFSAKLKEEIEALQKLTGSTVDPNWKPAPGATPPAAGGHH